MKLSEMTMKQLKTRRRISAAGAFILSVAPVSIVILSKWRVWVTDPSQAISIGTGGIMVGAVVLLSILGRLKVPGDIWVWTFSLILMFLLKNVINDLLILNAALLGGRVCDKILTATYVKRVKKELEARDVAERTGRSVMDGIKSYLEESKK